MSLNVIALGGNAILDKDPSDEGQKAVSPLSLHDRTGSPQH